MSLKNTVSGIPPPNKCELYVFNEIFMWKNRFETTLILDQSEIQLSILYLIERNFYRHLKLFGAN